MIRSDSSKYVLFIEPPVEQKLEVPVDDDWVHMMEQEMAIAKKGISAYSDLKDDGEKSFQEGAVYKGMHETACGEISANYDLQLSNGLITNSLAVFYLRWYRNSISYGDWMKLKYLAYYHEAKKKVGGKE